MEFNSIDSRVFSHVLSHLILRSPVRGWGSGKIRWVVVVQSLSHVWVLQQSRLPGPSLSPRVYSSSCPLSWWCHQPSHPLLPSSPPALNLSQYLGLFQRVSSSHQVAKVLELQRQSSKLLAIRSLISLDPGIIVDIKRTSGYMHSILEAVECWRHNRNITSLSERWTSCS